MSACTICNARFGIKFNKFVCSLCEKEYCSAHLIKSKYLELAPSVRDQFSLNDGLCHQCIFTLWGKANTDLDSPKGVSGRLATVLKLLWVKTKSRLSNKPLKTDLVKISEDSFEDMNSNRAWIILKHQEDVGYDFILEDLTTFARLYAVSQGRKCEKDFSLKDVYQLVDWLKRHPKLPNWLHRMKWKTIESGPDGISYIQDIWHLVSAAVALTNPATGLPWAAYHLGDRVVEQQTGSGTFKTLYNKLKDKFELNLNPKKALVSYLAGLFILQLYSKPE